MKNSRELDRLWFTAVTAWTIVVLTFAGVAGVVGPNAWFNSASLRGLHHLTHTPWPVVGVLFLLDAVMLAIPRWRLIGWLFGVAMSALFAMLTVVYVIIARDFSNPFSSALLTLTPLLFTAGARGWVTRDGEH